MVVTAGSRCYGILRTGGPKRSEAGVECATYCTTFTARKHQNIDSFPVSCVWNARVCLTAPFLAYSTPHQAENESITVVEQEWTKLWILFASSVQSIKTKGAVQIRRLIENCDDNAVQQLMK